MTPTGGLHLSAVEEKERGAGPDWAGGGETGRREGFSGPREKKKNKRSAGLETGKGEEEVLHFLKKAKTRSIQI